MAAYAGIALLALLAMIGGRRLLAFSSVGREPRLMVHRELMIHPGYPPQRQANHWRQQRPDHGEDPRLGSDMHLRSETL